VEELAEVEQFTSWAKQQSARNGDWPVAIMSTEALAHTSAVCGLVDEPSALPATVASPSTATSTPRKFPNTHRIFTQLTCTFRTVQDEVFNVLDSLFIHFRTSGIISLWLRNILTLHQVLARHLARITPNHVWYIHNRLSSNILFRVLRHQPSSLPFVFFGYWNPPRYCSALSHCCS